MLKSAARARATGARGRGRYRPAARSSEKSGKIDASCAVDFSGAPGALRAARCGAAPSRARGVGPAAGAAPRARRASGSAHAVRRSAADGRRRLRLERRSASRGRFGSAGAGAVRACIRRRGRLRRLVARLAALETASAVRTPAEARRACGCRPAARLRQRAALGVAIALVVVGAMPQTGRRRLRRAGTRRSSPAALLDWRLLAAPGACAARFAAPAREAPILTASRPDARFVTCAATATRGHERKTAEARRPPAPAARYIGSSMTVSMRSGSGGAAQVPAAFALAWWWRLRLRATGASAGLWRAAPGRRRAGAPSRASRRGSSQHRHCPAARARWRRQALPDALGGGGKTGATATAGAALAGAATAPAFRRAARLSCSASRCISLIVFSSCGDAFVRVRERFLARDRLFLERAQALGRRAFAAPFASPRESRTVSRGSAAAPSATRAPIVRWSRCRLRARRRRDRRAARGTR